MIDHAATFRAHQRARFLRPDAARFIRPDAARFLKPDSDPVEVFPALDRKYGTGRLTQDRHLAADIEREQELLADLRRELAAVGTELLGRRSSSSDQQKYSPTQRRIPAGQPGGGRWTDEQGGGGGGAGAVQTDAGSGGEDVVAEAEASFAFQGEGNSGSLDDWNALLDGLNVDSPAQPIPNASPDDADVNAEDINARRGSGPGNYFPGASAQQQARLDQAIARSENALTQIRQYEPDWRPREPNVTVPGSVEGAIGIAEARATEAELRFEQLRSGIGGNFAPPLNPPPRTGTASRVFDGGAWIDVYRTINNAPNLFGEPAWPLDDGTVAVAKIDGHLYFGVNRWAPGYTAADYSDANGYRWKLINRYPDVMETFNIGQAPNNALYHAESNLLTRAAREGGGSLAGRVIEVEVDREVCWSCGKVLPLLGLELGNPLVIFVERGTGIRSIMSNGVWLVWRGK